MADYKAMYLTAMDAMERAIALLAEAQQKCEDLYVATSGEELLGKLKQLAAVHKRSANKEMEFALEQYVAAYEKEHGSLSLPQGE